MSHIYVKVLAKILASRLAKVIHKITHRDQSGLIPSCFTVQNLICLFLNIQLPVDNPENRSVFSVDASKATVNNLWEVLEPFAMGGTFIEWICVLYVVPFHSN